MRVKIVNHLPSRITNSVLNEDIFVNMKKYINEHVSNTDKIDKENGGNAKKID